MPPEAELWRVLRPLRVGASAAWVRSYYDQLFELCFVARDVEDVAQIAIRHAYETFRPDAIAVALQDGQEWNVLPYRENGRVAPPMRFPVLGAVNGPLYEPGQILEIADLARFSQRFPSMASLVESGISSIVASAFGSRIHGRGYLIFCARGRPQHYSDDEYTLMCLHALATGIGLDLAGARR